jgi:cytochrome c-type biogenesis protein CcmF
MSAVLLGTLYPLILDALNAGKISVGPPYFDTVFYPLMVPAVFLMAIGPVASWKRAALPDLWTRLRWALGASIATALVLPFALGHWSVGITFGLWLGAWVTAASLAQFAQRLRIAPQATLRAKLAAQPFAWYGMMVAHLGIAVFIFGVTLVRGYETERDLRMAPGETVAIGGYRFTFKGTKEVPGPNYAAIRGEFEVRREGSENVMVMNPEKRVYEASGQTMTEAAIDTGFTRDLYVSLGEPVGDDAWGVRIYHKPFVDWIWGGCFIMALGGFLALADRRYRSRKLVSETSFRVIPEIRT